VPLVRVNKAKRLRAAAAAADPYALANRHVPMVASAFAQAARNVIAPGNLAEILRSGPDVVPWFDPAKPETAMAWDAFSAPVGKALARVVAASIAVAKDRPNIPRVPVNERSLEWARKRGAKLIRGISADTRETVRRIIARGLERGHRADTMANAIKRSVGLLPREEAAVERRRELLAAQDLSDARVEALSDKYASDLLAARAERIARTETIAAQNRGLLDTWQEASAEGALPAGVQRVWSAAPESENPNRPCAICIELDGKTTSLDEPFYSEVLGEDLMTPPSHPGCRCNMLLRRGES
jgi:hypothetical protein